MRLKLISCRVFHREMQAAIKDSPHEIESSFLPQGLHDVGCTGMLQRISAALDQVDESRHDAVVFGYGLCGNGLAGLTARSIPVVLPRAHDCITLFMGGKERYRRAFDANPGVYYKTSGWIENRKGRGVPPQLSIPLRQGLGLSRQEYIARYGEENGNYLFEQLGGSAPSYGQYTFIEMGVEPDDRFEKQTRDDADKRGWEFEKIAGDMTLIRKLLQGDWTDDEFLVVQPGWRVVPGYDDRILRSEKISPENDGRKSCRRAREPVAAEGAGDE